MTYEIGDLITYGSIAGGRIKGRIIAVWSDHHNCEFVTVKVTTPNNRLYPRNYEFDIWTGSVFLHNRSK